MSPAVSTSEAEAEAKLAQDADAVTSLPRLSTAIPPAALSLGLMGALCMDGRRRAVSSSADVLMLWS